MQKDVFHTLPFVERGKGMGIHVGKCVDHFCKKTSGAAYPWGGNQSLGTG